MLDKIREHVNNYKEDMIKDIIGIIQIKSVEDFSDSRYPMGKGNSDCLEYIGNICRKFGFSWTDMNGYAGFSDFGSGEKMMGILGHVDVVPEGKGWTVPPYEGTVKDGKLYGRGSVDDKGPMIAALYAMKLLKDIGFTPASAVVRAIFGTNEETGWKGIQHYLENEREPDFGVTPDGEFPIIRSEKGMHGFELIFSRSGSNVKKAYAGERPNVVPARAAALIDKDAVQVNELLKKGAYKVKMCGFDELEEEEQAYLGSETGTYIVAEGKSAHASLPHLGHNAISELCMFLHDLYPEDAFLSFYADVLKMESDGKSAGVAKEHPISGALTLNCGILRCDNTSAKIELNIRYPMSITWQEIEEKFRAHIKKYDDKADFNETCCMDPLLVEDEFLLSNLKKAYEDCTGEEAKMLAIGGGTYAKAVKNTVAFGPLFPGREECAHQPDEYIFVDDLVKTMEIYAYAIYLLTK